MALKPKLTLHQIHATRRGDSNDVLDIDTLGEESTSALEVLYELIKSIQVDTFQADVGSQGMYHITKVDFVDEEHTVLDVQFESGKYGQGGNLSTVGRTAADSKPIEKDQGITRTLLIRFEEDKASNLVWCASTRLGNLAAYTYLRNEIIAALADTDRKVVFRFEPVNPDDVIKAWVESGGVTVIDLVAVSEVTSDSASLEGYLEAKAAKPESKKKPDESVRLTNVTSFDVRKTRRLFSPNWLKSILGSQDERVQFFKAGTLSDQDFDEAESFIRIPVKHGKRTQTVTLPLGSEGVLGQVRFDFSEESKAVDEHGNPTIGWMKASAAELLEQYKG